VKILSFAIVACLFVASVSAQEAVVIVGSGSDLPRPLYEAWTAAFNQRSPAAQARYLPLGNAESIKQISSGNGDFGAGETPLTDDQASGTRVKLTSLPVALVAVVMIYNVPGVGSGVHFSGEALADIFLGKIRDWNDATLSSLNPGVKFPNLPIRVVHRTEGKGTNYILSDFLSKVSPAFRERIGKSPSPNWVLGKSANRNQDMVDEVASTPGAIGYVERAHVPPQLSVGLVRNAAGKFVNASADSAETACRSVLRSGTRDFQVSLTNAPGPQSYPLTSFTYMYLPKRPPDTASGRILAAFFDFVVTDGQRIAISKNYAVLPKPLLERVRASWH
jgi:phosphate transport system substrate-binding protein